MATLYRCQQCGRETFHEHPIFCPVCGSATFTAKDADELGGGGVNVGPDNAPAAELDDEPSEGHWADVPEPDELAGLDDAELERRTAPFTCSQEGCSAVATSRYTWPGNSEQLSCTQHALEAKNTLAGIGVELEILPL